MRMYGISFSVILFSLMFLLNTGVSGSQEDHSQHMQHKIVMGKKKTRTLENYAIPNVTLINQDGKKVVLPKLLNTSKPVILDFIFATCNTICPVLSATMANVQEKLGAEAADVQFVSITIDPEFDAPEVLKEYGQRYEAGPGWEFLTGSREDIDRVMKAFNAYVTNKMSHYPLTFLQAAGGTEWVRVDGLMGSGELMEEYRRLLKN